MIERVQGDVVRADAEALVNTVNCVGVMGRGVALQFRKVFPSNYQVYRATCERGQLRPGMMLVHDLGPIGRPRYIINFPTKQHWRGKSRLDYIDAGLVALIEEVRSRGIRSIAIPPLGAGLGGLNWSDVRPRIERAFQELPEVHVLLFEPAGAPAPTEMVKDSRPPRLTVGRAALLGLMSRYLAAAMDPWVTLLEIHKLMYFMQEAGEPLRLDFEKGFYGPYAPTLRHVLNRIEGHFIKGYGDAEDSPGKEIELNPQAVAQAEAFLADHPDTRTKFDRVAHLLEGFETSYGLELLATVHWVAAHEDVRTVDQAIATVYAWNERKRMFPERHLRIAWDTLRRQEWIAG